MSHTRYKAGAQRELVRSQTHRLARLDFGHAFHLEEDLAGTNDCDPVVRSAFAFTHTGFSGLLGDRLVGEEAHPDLAATLDETRHRDTAGLDLAVGDVAALHDLQPEVAKRQLRTAPRLTRHPSALLLAELNLLWHQHNKY